MRHSSEIESFIGSLNLAQLPNPSKGEDYTDYCLGNFNYFLQDYAPESFGEVMRKFAQFGIVFGYGDGLAYENHGTAIIGHSEAGKTTLLRGLVKASPEKVTKLNPRELIYGYDQDQLLLSHAPDKGRLRIHKFPGGLPGGNWPEVVRNCVGFVEDDPGYPLETVIYLEDTNSRPAGFYESLDKFPPLLAKEFLFCVDANYSMLDQVNFLYYNNPHDILPVSEMVADVASRLEISS